MNTINYFLIGIIIILIGIIFYSNQYYCNIPCNLYRTLASDTCNVYNNQVDLTNSAFKLIYNLTPGRGEPPYQISLNCSLIQGD